MPIWIQHTLWWLSQPEFYFWLVPMATTVGVWLFALRNAVHRRRRNTVTVVTAVFLTLFFAAYVTFAIERYRQLTGGSVTLGSKLALP